MSKDKQTYNPCDDCQYSYSKNGQESGMCKICEFTYFKDRKQSENVIELPERYAEITDDFILALTAVMHFCIKYGKPTPVSTYQVDNKHLGKRQIRVIEAIYLLDRWLYELAKKEGST